MPARRSACLRRSVSCRQALRHAGVTISGDPSLCSGQGLFHGVYPESGHKRFFAPLRMTISERFAMALCLCQVIYDVCYIIYQIFKTISICLRISSNPWYLRYRCPHSYSLHQVGKERDDLFTGSAEDDLNGRWVQRIFFPAILNGGGL